MQHSVKELYASTYSKTTKSTLIALACVATAVAIFFTTVPPLPPLLRTTISIYILVEVAFFFYGRTKYAQLNQSITKFPDDDRVATAMRRFIDLHPIFGLDDFLSGWFLGSSMPIPRENVIEFVSYGFYCQETHDLSPMQRCSVDDFVAQVEQKWDIKFEDGYDPSLRFMAHVWEPLRVSHKPLAVYVVTETAAKIAHLLLRLMGFKKGRHGAFTTWTSSGWNSIHHPVGEGGSVEEPSRSSQPGSTTPSPLVGGVTATSPHSTRPGSSGTTPRSAVHMMEKAHSAAEHALDAALAATSAAAASVTKQYPHEGQQYHLPHSNSPVHPIITTFRNLMMRRVSLPAPSSPRRRSRRRNQSDLRTIDSAMSVDFNEYEDGGDTTTTTSTTTIATTTTPTTATTVPVVFLHGVGFGQLPYLAFIRSLMKECPNSPFILLEIPHVALRLCRQAESVDDVAAAAVAAVQSLKGNSSSSVAPSTTSTTSNNNNILDQACFVGHSYGTFCTSRIVQLFPTAVHSVAMLDPVCLLTCYPQLLYNFIYKSSNNVFTSVAAAVDGVRFLCSRDLTISQAFCRLFHWSDLMLWPEDLPRKRKHALVVLSGKDDLVPGELVSRQFEAARHPATVMYHPDMGHGGLLLDREWMRAVVEGVKGLVHRRNEGEEEEEED